MKFLKKWLVFAIVLCGMHNAVWAESSQLSTQKVKTLVDMCYEGFNNFYSQLNLQEQGEVNDMLQELIVEHGNNFQELCETKLKNNELMTRYAQFIHPEQCSMNVTFGSVDTDSNDIITNYTQLENIDITVYRNNERIDAFYNTLTLHEQELFNNTLEEIIFLCKTCIITLANFLNEHPQIQTKLKKFASERNLKFVVIVGLDNPLPFFAYQLI